MAQDGGLKTSGEPRKEREGESQGRRLKVAKAAWNIHRSENDEAPGIKTGGYFFDLNLYQLRREITFSPKGNKIFSISSETHWNAASIMG